MADRLDPNQRLNHNESITSSNGRYRLVMQADGNFVLYRTSDGRPLWAANTMGSGKFAIMQADGNLVVYNLANQALWASGTNGRPGSYLVMQNDGNLVVYQPNVAVWATGTHTRGGLRDSSAPLMLLNSKDDLTFATQLKEDSE
jgi:hypothetical protein